MPSATLPIPLHAHKGRRCHHTKYRLTCEEFDDLRWQAGGRCEICGTREEDTSHRQLHIDHEPMVGDWAVRGLLCGRCNTHMFTSDGVSAAARERFLETAWYLSFFMAPPPEPGMGACVRTRQQREYRREQNGWLPTTYGRVTMARTWQQLWRQEGPHLLRWSSSRWVSYHLEPATGYDRERIRKIARDAGVEDQRPRSRRPALPQHPDPETEE